MPKVYIVNDEGFADEKVYVVQNESFADKNVVKVYDEASLGLTGTQEGVWTEEDQWRQETGRRSTHTTPPPIGRKYRPKRRL